MEKQISLPTPSYTMKSVLDRIEQLETKIETIKSNFNILLSNCNLDEIKIKLQLIDKVLFGDLEFEIINKEK